MESNKKKIGITKLVVFLNEEKTERQVITSDLTLFQPSFSACRELAEAVAGNRKVYGFELV